MTTFAIASTPVETSATPSAAPVEVVNRIDDVMVTPDAENAVIDLSTVFRGEGLTYTVQTALGEIVNATVGDDGKLVLDFGELGFSDVKVTATDASGHVVSDYFRVRVAGENAYTIAVLPDTQDYTDHPELSHIFGDMTQWLVDNKDSHNIQFMIHVGDITQNNRPGEWDVAEAALRKLDGKIPYSLLPGNHDQATGGTAADHSSVYLDERFSPEKQKATNPDTFGGVYDQEPDSSRNSYSTFTAPDGTKWLVLSMEFGPRDDVIRWAGEVIEGHLDHRVIIASHALTDYAGRHDALGGPLYDEGAGYDYGMGRDPQGANDGEAVYRELIAKYPNVTMTFSGHIFGDGAETNVSYSQYGNSTFEMLVNYQNGISREITGNGNEALGNRGGNGAMRLVVVDPDNNTISTETYFTEFDDYLDGYRVKPELDRDGLTGEYRGHQETFEDVDVGTPELFAMAKAGDDLTIEAEDGADTAAVTLNASRSLNPKSEALTYSWTNKDGDVIATGARPTVDLGLGKHELTLTVTDASGMKTTDEVLVIVRGDDTLLVENFNDGNANGWATGPAAGVEITVGDAASHGIPALGASDKVAFVPALANSEKLQLSPVPGAPTGTAVKSYSLVYDIYVPSATASAYTALFQTDIANNSDGDLFIHKTGATTGGIGIGGNYQGTFQFDAWQRVAFVFEDQGDGNLKLSKYINGTKVGEQTVAADRYTLDASKGALLFSDEDGETSPLYVSSVLVTDKVYTAAEIEGLGGPKAGGIVTTPPTPNSTQFDFNAPDLAPTFGPGEVGLGEGGTTGPFLLKGTVFSRPDAEDGVPSPEAALWDMSDAANNKLVWTGEGAQTWSDYVFEASITSTDNDTVGLLFYYQDDLNYYRFTMDGETNRRELVKVKDGVETVLASTAMGYQFNVELMLKVAIVDNEINVFLGDRNVFGGPVVDENNALTHGAVGLYSSEQRSTRFDDIAVTRAGLTAHAGEDARLFDLDGDGAVEVALDGGGSFGLAEIVTWRWTDADGNEIATGRNPAVELGAGRHELTLTVTDAGGRTATDRVNVEVMAKEKILVSENFSAPASLSRWTIVDEGEFGGIGADGKSSEWLIRDGKLIQTTDLQSRELTWNGATNPDYWQRGWSPLGDGVNVLRVGTYALYNDPAAREWDDYSIETTVQTPDNDGLGLLFHYTDARNFYKLELDAEGTLDRNPGNGAGSVFNLVRMRNGVEEILGQVPGKYEPGQPMKLRLDIVDQKITAYLNGEAIFYYPIEDHGNERGTFGLYSWGNQGLTFDNVIVTDITPAVEEPGDQVIVGTDGDDTLVGGSGDDVITGKDGDDELTGMAGDDELDGGSGDDVLDGGEDDDTLAGGAGDDLIKGDAGDDTIQGGAGNDMLDYSEQTGAITLNLQAGTATGTDIGSDTFAGIETVALGSGNDRVTGSNGNDVVDGGAGDDAIDGGSGNDTLAGSIGNDSMDGGSGADRVDGGIGDDVLRGGSGDDVVDGGAGEDQLDGGSGADILIGGDGNDTIDGGSGNDRLIAGGGDDALTGGSGRDIFVFASDFGRDVIKDFSASGANTDVLEFSTDLFADYAALLDAAEQVGRDVTVAIDADTSLTLSNVQLTSLAADDFRFV
ncbi:metallophosphoesterase [Bradyrhizobium sp. LHD-71]|uniref:metallophosphoesterase n=1 Tax=Bradyrhizobium sp. LHD-71 TaxID=3072141 RepID=UPI002810639E|nr:metallophosphoesterase [Bradyrhizobium sp. LHD-71]MDQ8731495.1 metallophosphoesterase [Bradyrhizobium sp. LHD-71]